MHGGATPTTHAWIFLVGRFLRDSPVVHFFHSGVMHNWLNFVCRSREKVAMRCTMNLHTEGNEYKIQVFPSILFICSTYRFSIIMAKQTCSTLAEFLSSNFDITDLMDALQIALAALVNRNCKHIPICIPDDANWQYKHQKLPATTTCLDAVNSTNTILTKQCWGAVTSGPSRSKKNTDAILTSSSRCEVSPSRSSSPSLVGDNCKFFYLIEYRWLIIG